MKIPNSSGRRWLAKLEAMEPKTRNIKRAIRYYTNLFRATPAWLDEVAKFRMRKIYEDAHARGLQVDHIVPLASSIVCGLHVPWNLQALSEEENSKKGNKYWPDCPYEQSGLDFNPQISLDLG